MYTFERVSLDGLLCLCRAPGSGRPPAFGKVPLTATPGPIGRLAFPCRADGPALEHMSHQGPLTPRVSAQPKARRLAMAEGPPHALRPVVRALPVRMAHHRAEPRAVGIVHPPLDLAHGRQRGLVGVSTPAVVAGVRFLRAAPRPRVGAPHLLPVLDQGASKPHRVADWTGKPRRPGDTIVVGAMLRAT